MCWVWNRCRNDKYGIFWYFIRHVLFLAAAAVSIFLITFKNNTCRLFLFGMLRRMLTLVRRRNETCSARCYGTLSNENAARITPKSHLHYETPYCALENWIVKQQRIDPLAFSFFCRCLPVVYSTFRESFLNPPEIGKHQYELRSTRPN